MPGLLRALLLSSAALCAQSYYCNLYGCYVQAQTVYLTPVVAGAYSPSVSTSVSNGFAASVFTVLNNANLCFYGCSVSQINYNYCSTSGAVVWQYTVASDYSSSSSSIQAYTSSSQFATQLALQLSAYAGAGIVVSYGGSGCGDAWALSSGAIAGIVIASVFVLIMVILLILCLCGTLGSCCGGGGGGKIIRTAPTATAPPGVLTQPPMAQYAVYRSGAPVVYAQTTVV